MNYNQHILDFRNGADVLWHTYAGMWVGIPNWSKPGMAAKVRVEVEQDYLAGLGRTMSNVDINESNRRMGK